MSKKVITTNIINPVDYYNKNCIEDVIMKLLQIKAVKEVGGKSLTYIENASDSNKSMILIDRENGFFEAQMSNGLKLPLGVKFTPFMVLQKCIFKDSFNAALCYVKYSIMNNKNEYVRVQGEYFENVKTVDRFGVERMELITVKRQTLLDDYNKYFLGEIDKYKTFTLVPDNKNYKKIINDSYNQYAEFTHKPIDFEDYKGDEQWKWTKQLLEHIFGDQYWLGLIYMKVIYEYPREALPILSLISQERQTGKTTFVNYISILFGGNTVIINPQDIGNGFNGQYALKNIIMIEESHFDSRQSMEKIKNLATQKLIAINIKFVQQYSVPFFGKIIITSNDENKFTKVDDEEIRFWVRKVPTLKGKANHMILDDLRDEIPAFLCFLENLHKFEGEHQKYLNEDGTINKSISRMILSEDDIITKALEDVKVESRESLHKEILIYLDDHALQNTEVEVFYFIGKDVKEAFFQYNNNFGVAYIDRVLTHNMGYKRSDTVIRYKPLEKNSANGYIESKTGRPFIFHNPYFNTDVNKVVEPTIDF